MVKSHDMLWSKHTSLLLSSNTFSSKNYWSGTKGSNFGSLALV